MGMRVDLPVEPRGWLELVIVFTCQARQEGMIIAHALQHCETRAVSRAERLQRCSKILPEADAEDPLSCR